MKTQMRFLVVAALCALEALSVSAAELDVLEGQVITEVYHAHVNHSLAPTCDDIRAMGGWSLEEVDNFEAEVKPALEAGVIGRGEFWMGVVALRRAGADLDALASRCWEGLPKTGELGSVAVALRM